ncbi:MULTISPECIES: DUF3099 domain-containing protein [Arsenicicoccus]|uniref:DUF3099 domain-containing protein n=1 Tax=Arsenicicoccus TaxID=267408 RepID=UPI002580336E|nr:MULTISPECIES: DUF3099 domain-containing protein [Arsenicicoccus]
MASSSPSHPTVHTVTSVQKSLAQDRAERTRRYLISMSIRTVCFVLFVVVDHPMRWVFVIGAVFLPYIAVVLANAVDRSGEGQLEAVDHQQRMLPPGSWSEGAIEGSVEGADKGSDKGSAEGGSARPAEGQSDERRDRSQDGAV